MAQRVGKCTNCSGCKLADRNEKITVVAKDFRCPECGLPLEAVGPKKDVPHTLNVLIGGGAVLLFIVGTIIWTLTNTPRSHVVPVQESPAPAPTPAVGAITPGPAPRLTPYTTPLPSPATPPQEARGYDRQGDYDWNVPAGIPAPLLPGPSPAPSPQDQLPTFFPPRATDRFPIPLRFAGENMTLQQLADRLGDALRDAGYEGKCSYYWVDDQHGPGFAIVTHIEHIQSDGKPVLGQRWGSDLPAYGSLTLDSLLRAITHADPGRYRLIALVVSRKPLIETNTPMDQEEVLSLNKGPRWLGDSPWKTVIATADFHLVAYVYEFARKSRSDAPVLMVSSDLTAKQHLQSTGLYEDLTRGFPK